MICLDSIVEIRYHELYFLCDMIYEEKGGKK